MLQTGGSSFEAPADWTITLVWHMNRYGKDYWTRPSSGFLKVETDMAPFTVEDITKLDRDWMPTTNEYLSAEELAARDFYLAEKKETIEYELEA